ncbi:MAG: AbrB/MazE/SpoVT family DNA-binding domain-containing protein [Candidatus Berkelbacteria bacterium]|nr:AbrB/MazE/SpoVT family DNA-binding domain-containing protein [Candidatus Berkelbacteria bacterium]
MGSENRKLIKFSNYSLCITLPASLVRRLKWKKGDTVKLVADEEKGEVSISKSKKVLATKKSKAELKSVEKSLPAKSSKSKSDKKSRW